MKKLILVPCLALLIGLFSVNNTALAGPPDGWGAPPVDGGIEEPVNPEPTEPDDSSDGTATPLGGPPDGWG
ncbi:hypothetical protein P9578_28455 [Brevibacillus choshinensis]|uniref:hypothetical protein n=1 Tax=Brevibacillus choshinensis TaxID=54911 RepID=UPI002E224418|nr:hypothetical protein [Brevibacillus choshinensis]